MIQIQTDSIFKNIKIYEVNGSDFVLDLDTSNSGSNDYAFTFTEVNAPAAILNDISSTSLVDNSRPLTNSHHF